MPDEIIQPIYRISNYRDAMHWPCRVGNVRSMNVGHLFSGSDFTSNILDQIKKDKLKTKKKKYIKLFYI